MRRYLVVANQTVGGEELDRAIRERVAAGPCTFYVVVPMIPPRLETGAWVASDLGFLLPPPPEDAVRDERQEAQRRSEHRLTHLLEALRAAGCDAEGEVGPTDPLAAVQGALGDRSFDEVLVSTLPSRLSRWLRLDLPRRIEKATGLPVVTVEAHG